MKEKTYLGDGVYAQNDGFGIILQTSDGIRVTNEIYLEPSVYQALVNYVTACSQQTIENK